MKQKAVKNAITQYVIQKNLWNFFKSCFQSKIEENHLCYLNKLKKIKTITITMNTGQI